MQDVIDHFIAARLITTNEIMTENVSRHATDKVPIIEISHEALISAWARLTDWIKVARDDMLVRQALNNDIEHWEEQNKPQNQLYSGHHLARIEALAKRTLLNKKEEEFLKDCKKLKWRRRAINISAAVIIFFLLVGGIAEGLMYITSRPTPTTVSTLQYSGPGSLSQIIHDAKPGSTITFAPSLQGTIYLTSQDLDIAKDLILSGPTSKQITISNHNSKGSYKVHIHTNANATFKNLVFSGSTVRQTSFIDNDGNLTLDNCSINHNTSYYNGGGIASSAESSLTLINSDVHDNAAQGNGGGIYIWQGSLKLNNSKVFNNSADENGGGIYAQNSGLALSGSQIFKNKTSSSNVTSNGGGISMLSGMLLLDTSSITGNTTRGFGGGITLLGSNGFISKSAIIQNHADQKGGGLAVEKNSETKNASLAVITNIEITNNPQGSYWIGHNSAHSASDILSNPPVISNQVSSINGPVIITNDTSEVTGSPAPLHPPENSLQYQGIVNLDEYCHHLYPNQRLSLGLITSEYINCDLLSGDQIIQSHPINTQKACQWRYNQSDIIDRLADYNDPSSWQCYVHEKKLGGITDYLDSFCKYQRFEGVTNNTSGTAYDWKCLDWHNVPTSLSITDACQWHYNRKDAFDRLTDFNRPNGWECWAPK
jgi:predicted outer membrane repeat protein